MAFSIVIKSKGLFSNKELDVRELLSNCKLNYGSYNAFYILEDDKVNNNAMILYNPSKIGRGIFFDCNKINEGEVSLSYNIPTTPTEISDFLNIVKEIERQYKKVEITMEDKIITVDALQSLKEEMIETSLSFLQSACTQHADKAYILTLALFPFNLSQEQREKFSSSNNLVDFENLLHDKQNIDCYYAKPSILENNETGKLAGFYALTEDCNSIFPIAGNEYLNLDIPTVDESFIRFFIASENRIVDGMFDYDKFIKHFSNTDVQKFDATHIIIPPLTKTQIDEIISKIS